MKLLNVTIKKYKNIIDSNVVKIQDDITCIVGKNESGKTAFLHALYRLNPARTNATFLVEDHYPAWLEKKDRQKGMELEKFCPIDATFMMENDLLTEIENKFGEKIISDKILSLSKAYDGTLNHTIKTDVKVALRTILKDLSFSRETRTEINKAETIEELKKLATTLKPSGEENQKDIDGLKVAMERIKGFYGDKTVDDAIWEIVKKNIPKFIYFDTYSTLPYSVEIQKLLKTNVKNLEDDELTALALLRMAGADDDYLLNPDYERRKRELENVANALSEDVLNYWSQNRDLRVLPDITQKTINNPHGQTTVVDELKIRIWDDKHKLSLPFDEHSSGFQWFFSFLAAFSEYEYSKDQVIILLDEPGLGLHGRAQADFLKFIEERLADKRQVIYSTHSPFMVQPNHLERARIVEEKDRNAGAKITEDVLTTDPDTLFPLQGALGYDLVQHLFIHENNLIIEGTSDFVYLTTISDYLRDQKKTYLDEKWSLVPVGGADLIPTFVALLGNHLDVTVIVDSRKEGHQKLSNLASKGYLHNQRIITVGEILSFKLADIEDLFDPEDYLAIYNRAFNKSWQLSDLQGKEPIVIQIARKEGLERFDHGKPADYFLRNKIEILPSLSPLTLGNFEKLIERVIKTLPSNK
jgi:predicted ATP-dependent endonuclease of OLD family